MAKIRILPEQLANRIAAGEVVERPASVVKELVENSLDSGADRIEVEIEGGGTRLIRVLDNGSGMDEDDVLLSFERHGTSKIHESHDLVSISSLGFRGEAIPSIASVSKMTIVSKTKDDDLGTKVSFAFGQLQKVHEIGCSQGTDIEVRNLFGKTPARKKFLRTARTEIGHIDEILKNYALVNPSTAFTLKVDGRESVALGSGHTIEQRLRHIFKYHETLISVGNPEKKTAARQLSGYLVPPEKKISGSARLRLFINGRAIRDRLMSHAAFEGLRGFLLKGHSPAGFLHLQIPAEEIDVNVHPAKHEVRFRSSGDVHQFVKQSIETAMRNYQVTLQSSYFSPPIAEDQYGRTGNNLAGAEDYSPGSITNDHGTSIRVPRTHDLPDEKSKVQQQSDFSAFVPPPIKAVQTHEPAPPPPVDEREGRADREGLATSQHGLRVIGQYKNLYIFCQAGDELLVIDQHAAHERLIYERLRRQYQQGRLASQNLLFPQTVELSPLQIELVENHRDELSRMGFAIGEFGGNSYILSAIPALAGQLQPDEIFFDVLEGFGSDTSKSSHGGHLDHVLATMACKAAVKSGDELKPSEIDSLLHAMARADLFSHCPHGRPVLKSFSNSDIKKWFNRT